MASFDENGKYIKTNWKAGDKITATKLNKIEESIEAVNDNDISRHVEADARLDALEAKDVAHDKEFTNVKNLIEDAKDAAELGDYEINSRMQFLEQELNEGIEEVHNVASTVDGKIATAEANMAAQVNTVKRDMDIVKNDVNKLAVADIIYVDDFIIGDNHTKAFQDAIRFCKSNGNKTLKTKGHKYTINERILIDFPLNIDFNDCVIEYDIPEASMEYYRHRGVFSFMGKVVKTVNISNFEPKLEYLVESGFCQNTSRVTCDDISDFAPGDYVKIDLPFSENVHSLDTYKPTVKILTKIVKIEDSNVYLEYYSPFDFSGVNIEGATLTKVECLENIEVKNATFINTTDITKVTVHEKYYAPMIFNLTANFGVSNVKSKNGVHSTIILDYCSNANISNIETIEPRILYSGMGYNMQIASSMYITVDKSIGVKSRHNVDFSMSAFCECTNSRGGDISNGSFDLHGICEHNISFNNCVGDIFIGNNTTQFPCLSTDIFINNHIGNFSACTCEKLSVSNSDIAFITGLKSSINELYITNSNLRLYDATAIYGENRGKQKYRRVKIVNSSIDSVDVYTDGQHFSIENFDFVDFVNNHVVGVDGKYLRFAQCNNIHLTQNTLLDTNMLIFNKDANVNYRICDNLIIDNTSNKTRAFRIEDSTNCSGTVIIKNNDIRINNAKTIFNYPASTNSFVLVLQDNIIKCDSTSDINISTSNTNDIRLIDNTVTNVRFVSMPNNLSFTPINSSPYILARIDSAPSPIRGSIYFNNTTGKIMKCNDGKNWEEI